MRLTVLFIIIISLLIFIYDIFTWYKFGVETTISRIVRSFNEKWPLFGPLLAFGMGMLFGHFFL